MTKLVIQPISSKVDRMTALDLLISCEKNKARFDKTEKKLKGTLEKVKYNHAKEIFLELTQTGLPEDAAFIDIINDTLASSEYIARKPDLKNAIQNIQHHQLQKIRANVRIYRKVPHLYTDTFLRNIFWNRVIYSEEELNVWFRTNQFCTASYSKMVQKNIEDFYTNYQKVMISYNHSIMQTQFKLQLIIGMDVSREILSYV
jgi:hypothetical protein